MYSSRVSGIPNCCRLCGATSYRRVIERDEMGQMRATSLYQCSGCSVVFADPKAWREGGLDVIEPAAPVRPLTPVSSAASGPSGRPPSPDARDDSFASERQRPAHAVRRAQGDT